MATEYISNDTNVDLVINRLSRSTYDWLSSEHKLDPNQLYLIDDEVFDMFNKRVVNVAEPISVYDATNVGYVDTYYVPRNKISAYFDSYRILSGDGTKSLAGDLTICKSTIGTWQIEVASGSIDPSQVKVEWDNNPGTGYGWNFIVNGTKVPTGNTNGSALAVQAMFTYEDQPTILKGERAVSWEAFDRVVPYSELSDFILSAQSLTGYYKKTETSSAVEISSAISGFAEISVDNKQAQDFKLLHTSYDEYAQLVADENVDPHTMYVLSADGYDDQYGNRITNVGAPISADDAATKNYVDESIAAIPPIDLSEYAKKSETSSDVQLKAKFDTLSTYTEIREQLSNDNYLTAHQSLAEYYKMSETSSKAEIANALNDKVDVADYNVLSNALSGAISADIKNLADNYAKKTDINIEYDSDHKKIWLSADDHVTSIDTDDFIKDGMISSVTYDEATHMLCIVWNTDAGGKTTTINLSGLIDTYTAGYGLSLANGEFSVDTEEIAQKSDLDNYYLTSETSSAIEISQSISDFVKVSVDNAPTKDFKLLHTSYDEYAQLVIDENVDPHTMYVLSADGYDDQYGNRVTNVGEPISASDATTKKYVDDSIAAIPPTDLTQYYKKSETSSAVELKTKFDTLSTYAEMHDQLSNDGYLTAHQSLADYYTKNQTSSATEISDAFDAIPLSNYVKLSSDNAQVISSEVGITKSLTVGSLSVVSNSSRFSYKLQSEESVNLQDRAINKLTMDSDLSVCFPAVKPSVARDFLLNLSYTSGQMTIVDEIEKCGDELSFTAGKQHLIAFTEIGIKNSLPQFYIRVIELD